MPFFVIVDEQLHVFGATETLRRSSAIAVEAIGRHGLMLVIVDKVQIADFLSNASPTPNTCSCMLVSILQEDWSKWD